ncbi:MAG TPA: hypothetical protein VGE59_02530 [Patescibacteria group bacterium]
MAAAVAEPTRVDAPPTAGELRMFELEARREALERELEDINRELIELRQAADLCETCGGTKKVRVRGGLYGELTERPCACAETKK